MKKEGYRPTNCSDQTLPCNKLSGAEGYMFIVAIEMSIGLCVL